MKINKWRGTDPVTIEGIARQAAEEAAADMRRHAAEPCASSGNVNAARGRPRHSTS